MKAGSKSERTRAAILAAARALFSASGYEATTIRDIAAQATIDPALVIRYFGSKEELFMLAADFDLRLPDLKKTPASAIGEGLIRHFIDVWEGAQQNDGMIVLLRSAASNDYAAAKLREIFAAQVAPALTRARPAGNGDVARRAALVSTQLLGLAFCRYVLKLPPVVAMSAEEIIEHVGPTLQAYVSGRRS